MLNFFFIALLFSGSSVMSQTVSTSANVTITNVVTSAVASGSASSAPTPTPSPMQSELDCPCNDMPPQAGEGEQQFSCAEQKSFGKCDEDFMLGFCECTCDRCCPCNDFPPPGDKFTCIQQKEFGKCDDDFMDGFCECECGRCGDSGTAEPTTETTTMVPTPTPSPTESPVIVTECPNGLIPIFGSSDCESVRCAQNRQRCANSCGGLAEIEFDCKDVSDGASTAFSSSCACAGAR
eukprot:TRINITY_DN5894_c0_g4_i3.p1 TRINITY_DN5894_c0_g4~~TRINITY_DN5894_c0_g4_i3.p1  ORF type:complete len:275 (-),score=36.09 TRINITY_DN5894_c0_g4_i3:858-1565(-)